MLIAEDKCCNGVLGAAIELLNRKGIDSVYEGKDTSNQTSEILKIVNLIENLKKR